MLATKSCTNTASLHGTPIAPCHPYPESLLLLARLGYSGGHGGQCLGTAPIATLAPKGRAQMMEAYSPMEEREGYSLAIEALLGWVLDFGRVYPPEAFIASETPSSADVQCIRNVE